MRWERTVTVIGCHVGGEDNHVIVGGVLPPPGATMFERKRYLETHGDELRRWLLLEPRGKPTLCVNLVTPPTRPDCDAGLIIMESTDYPPMSGSNTICTVTVLLETGMLPMREQVTTLTLDTPAGPVPVEARCREDLAGLHVRPGEARPGFLRQAHRQSCGNPADCRLRPEAPVQVAPTSAPRLRSRCASALS